MTEPFKNTPPAPESKGEMTAANVAAALAGESQASQKYLAFADVADAEGYPNAARLFRAVAFAESTHARNHLSVLGQIGSTEENLKAAWSGETFEIDEMYAAYNAVARIVGGQWPLAAYDIKAVTEGRDALGEVTVRVKHGDGTFTGRGLASDIIESSILAYVNAINRALAREKGASA